MAKISLMIPDEALELIDSVSENRSAFMVKAAVRAARVKEREMLDAEIAQSCAANASEDASIDAEFAHTLRDGLVDVD
jgi:hypothetical protein